MGRLRACMMKSFVMAAAWPYKFWVKWVGDTT